MADRTTPVAGLPRTVRRSLWIVSAAVALTQGSWGLIIPVLPVYAQRFQASSAQLGIVVGAFSLARILVNVPSGMLADRISRRGLLCGAIGGVAVVQAATALAWSLPYLVVMRVLLGLAGGVAITVSQTVMADLTDERTRAHAMAHLQAMQLGASAFGPAVGGLIAGLLGPRASFLFSAGVALVVMVLVTRLPAQRGALRRERPSQAAPGPAVIRLARNRSFLAICVISFTVFFARFGGQQTLIALIAYTRVHLSTTIYGLALSSAAIANLATVRLVARISNRSRKVPIVSSLLLAALTYGAFGLVTGRLQFFLAMAVLAVSNELSGPVPATYCADVLPASVRGRGFGIFRTCGDTGGLLGPILLGVVIDHWSLSWAAVATGLLALVAASIFAAAARETVPPRSASPRPGPLYPGPSRTVPGADDL